MSATKAMMLYAVCALVACGCTKKKSDKTCKSENDNGATLVAPWTDLGIAEGEICIADATHLKFIAKHKKNPIGYAEAVGDKLTAKGWNPVDGKMGAMDPKVYGKGGAMFMSIYGWEFRKGAHTLTVHVGSYGSDSWNDDPVTIELELK